MGFNRINSCRSIPTVLPHEVELKFSPVFQSYQFMQINPDLLFIQHELDGTAVSIVSIHADQSRLSLHKGGKFVNGVSIVSIHADQSRPKLRNSYRNRTAEFQSYQFMQINPDLKSLIQRLMELIGFNRINSCRSIPTKVNFKANQS